MIRDPLYRKIEERLGGTLDPALFERCAWDLLRDVYPGLVPIAGGDDGGMDGAISDEDGGVLPLIVTTAKDDLANLTGSLKSYRRHGGRATEAVFATSQALTPRKRRSREARAKKKELGFTLRNIHDRADFAGRLYRNSKWRLELLGLPGDPPALSALPRLPGPYRVGELIGRDEELDWLRRHQGDALLVGQPGVGKTALFETLAKEGLGLFAVSEDPGQIADAFRDNPVQFVFVDDAHLGEPLLDLLTRLREEPGLGFAIAASTWPTRADALARRLYVTRDYLMPVGGLPRETVADIIRRKQPDLSSGVIGEILNQTEDPPDDAWKLSGSCRPGLALTLARQTSWWGLKKLVDGGLLIEGLSRDARLSGTHLDCMATFALGGAAGMRQAKAARALDLSEVEVRGMLEPLAGTGILTDSRSALAIRPSALRHALVARTFFSGGSSLSLDPALECVEDAVACTETLLGALERGAAVSHQFIRQRLDDHQKAHVGNQALDVYARTGAEGAKWVIEQYPDRAVSIASEALLRTPKWAVRRLLALALGDAGPREARAEPEATAGSHATGTPRPVDLLSEIDTWVRAGRPGSCAVTRRRGLLRALMERGESASGRPSVVAGLVRACFSLSFMAMQGDAVSRGKFGMAMGSLTGEDVTQLAGLWPDAMRTLTDLGDPGMACARGVIQEWTAGVRVLGRLPETRVASRAEVPRMLEQAFEVWREPGFLHWACGIAREHALDVRIPEIADAALNRWIDALYPRASVDRDTRREMTSAQQLDETRVRLQRVKAAALGLAEEWRREKPETVVNRMLVLKRQGKLSGYGGTRPLDLIAVQLAEMVDDPLAWLGTFASRPAPEAWIGSFLAAAVAADPSGEAPWRTLERIEGHGVGMWAGLQVGLYLRDPPRVAVQHVMAAARENAGVLRDAVQWSDVPDEWRIRLLKDRDETVRGETAAALWDVHDRRPPPGNVGVAWRDAAVTCGGPELLHDVLRSDRDAANAWILYQAEESSRRKAEEVVGTEDPMEFPLSPEDMRSMAEAIRMGLSERNTRYSLDTELLAATTDAIGREDRRRLLRDISAEADSRFFEYLVRGDPELEGIARERGLGGPHLELDAW